MTNKDSVAAALGKVKGLIIAGSQPSRIASICGAGRAPYRSHSWFMHARARQPTNGRRFALSFAQS
jgi:hypothetical protein